MKIIQVVSSKGQQRLTIERSPKVGLLENSDAATYSAYEE